MALAFLGVTVRTTALLALIVPAALYAARAQAPPAGQPLFEEDFESGLKRWRTRGLSGVVVRDSADPAHRNVLALTPNGDVYALINGSEGFGSVRIEGDVRFVDDTDNYLGVIYNLGRRGRREDFGGIYIKGNDSYLQANPHRDWNVGRTLYPEYRAPLRGEAQIRVGEWQRFAMEVVGDTAHFYVANARTPQMTFPGFERRTGAIGFQPRSVGGEVWIDNIRVTSIDRFAYSGPPVPDPRFDTSGLLTAWQLSGPYPQTRDELAREPKEHARQWRPFETDARGAVVTGRIVDFHGPNTVAYFRTQVDRRASGLATLRLSTVDDLALWVNGRFHWFIPRDNAAWFDFLRNPARRPQNIPLDLVAGRNDLVFRTRGGVYATGGFFAAVLD